MRIFVQGLVLLALFVAPCFAQSKELIISEKDLNDVELISLLKNCKKKPTKCYVKANKVKGNKGLALSLAKFLTIYSDSETYDIADIIVFLKQNSWLSSKALMQKLERSINPKIQPEKIIMWFKFHPPRSSYGKLMLINAKIDLGLVKLNDFKVQDLLAEYWIYSKISSDIEKYFMEKYKNIISFEHYNKKIDFLMWIRGHTAAKFLIKELPRSMRDLHRARFAILRNPNSAISILKKKPYKIRNDLYILYVRAKHFLKKRQYKKAIAILTKVKPKKHFNKWWELKSVAIRDALRKKDYQVAYRLTQNHGLGYGVDMANAHWLAGWIALRFLGKPKDAVKEFRVLYDNSNFMTSKTKAAYWLGRSYKVLGDNVLSAKWLSIAAKNNWDFYGQLAAASIQQKQPIYFPDNQNVLLIQPGYYDMQKVWKLAYLASILWKSDYQRLARNLVTRIASQNLKTSDIKSLVVFFTKNTNFALAVLLAKNAANKGQALVREGYPTLLSLRAGDRDPAFYFAIIRQESNFDQSAISPAGAKGLMQIMPATAKKLAKSLGLPKSAYANNASANIAKGMHYLDELHDELNSNILAIIAYNAGKRNAKKWVKEFGDVRLLASHQDIVDWIELIPYKETRFYVKKVLANYVVYDSMSSKNHSANTIIEFLKD